MTVVYCFSGSGHSMAVAEFLAARMGCDVTGISGEAPSQDPAGTAVVIFPVYCQNIPQPVRRFLKRLDAKYVALIATYGRISYGNVLYEAQKIVPGQVIAGVYVPTGHTFLKGDTAFDEVALMPLLDRLDAPQKAHIPKTRKNILANIFPALRSRMGVKITRTSACNRCGVCEAACPMGAIREGTIGPGCIRCLRCVTNCPQAALGFANSRILDKYLKHYRKDVFRLYL